MEITIHLSDRRQSVQQALASNETFAQFVTRVQKNGLTIEEGGVRRFIPPKMIRDMTMPIEQKPPAEATPVGAATLRLVVVTHFDKKSNRSAMYLNGTLVPGHIADWRQLAAALAAVPVPLTVLKENWTTTLSLNNLPPAYRELERIAHADNYETFQDAK